MIDTLEIATKAQAAGFTEKQAKFFAELQSELITKELVTRDYLDARFAEFENRVNARFTTMETKFMEGDNRSASEFLRVQAEFVRVHGAFGKMEERIKLLTFLLWPVLGSVVVLLIKAFFFR